MDDPGLPPDELDHAMRHLIRINQLLNGYGPSLVGIERLLPLGATSFSLLDVGCGSGDTLRAVAEWAHRRQLKANLHGIELSAASAQRATEACCHYPEIQISHADLFSLTTDEGPQFDIVHSALVLHHFSDDNLLVQALAKMRDLARLGVVVNDLHRHPFAYHSIRMFTRAFSRSYVLHNDAPLSVARAFTRFELQSFARGAGFRNPEITWHWAFRWCLTGQK